jgi:hypothetical protein
MVRQKRGDRFSRLVLSMWTFFDGIDTSNCKNKNLVLQAVENTEMFIGVVAEPEFNEDEGHFTCIFSVARKLKALVFGGEAMQDAEGRKLLGSDGSFE